MNPVRWPRHGAWRLALALGSGLWAGCEPTVVQPPAAAPLRVEYAGCQAVLPGPTCRLAESRELRLWVPAAHQAAIEILAGGKPLPTTGRIVRDGQRFHLNVPAAVDELTVRRLEPAGETTWSLALAEPETPTWSSLADAARATRDPEELAALRQELQALAESPEVGDRGALLWLLAGIELRLGSVDSAVELLETAIAEHRDHGRTLEEAREAGMLAYLHIQERRFAEVREFLDHLDLNADSPAEAACWTAYYQGVLSAEVGDSRSALQELREASRVAERVGMDRERRMARQILGWQLQALGRSREAADLFAELRETAANATLGASPQKLCDRARLLDNQAWSLLLAREAGDPADDPIPVLEEAREIFAAEACARSEDRVNVLVNLALAEVQNGRFRAARAALDQVHHLAERPSPVQRLWWLDIEGRIALGESRPTAALDLYTRLSELAESTFTPEARWRSAVGRARAHQALEQTEAALDALEEAESWLDDESLQIALGEGRDTFAAQREAGTRLHLDLLVDHGRIDEALAAARRARSRVLRGLQREDRLAQLDPDTQERWDRTIAEYRARRDQLAAATAEDWQRSAAELRQARSERTAQREEMRRLLDRAFTILGTEPGKASALVPPVPGELLLTYHPSQRGWIGFAASIDRTVAHRLELPTDLLENPSLAGRHEALAAQLLEPFAAEIRRADRLRVLPYGALREIDFHALPFDGDVLLAARPVAYALDLTTSRPAVLRPGGNALVLADPRGDLPAARREAWAVHRQLASSGWQTELLEGSSATLAAVRAALSTVDLLHYAGHGVYAGRGGWESGLALADRGRLTPGDLLALERAPARIVLSGCETARSSPGAVEGLGIAHAFLLAGTRQVIAAVRPVGDRATAGLIAELYRDPLTLDDPAAALRHAQLAWQRSDPEADWSSFRLLEP